MTNDNDSTLRERRRHARLALLEEALGRPAREIARVSDDLLEVYVDVILTRFGYAYREPGEWQVRRRYLPLWRALRAHLERFRAIERRLVAETEWHARRAA